jgi:DNA-binding GntR family transcriptional regulator
MNYIYVNKELRTPLYRQIHQSIRRAILQGELNNNDPLPYEEEIADFYNISRVVVRMAYKALEDERLIKRIKRLGTFVQRKHLLQIKDTDVIDLLGLLRNHNLEPSVRTLLVEYIQQNDAYFPNVFDESTTSVLRLIQLVESDHHPFALVEYYLPQDIDVYLIEAILHSDNIINAMDQSLRLNLERASVTFGAEQVRDIYAKSLGLDQDDVVYRYRITYKDSLNAVKLFVNIISDGSVIEHVYQMEVNP